MEENEYNLILNYLSVLGKDILMPDEAPHVGRYPADWKKDTHEHLRRSLRQKCSKFTVIEGELFKYCFRVCI
jgi:hypothetical protein